MQLTDLSFISHWEEGRLSLNIPVEEDYRKDCNAGSAAAMEYVQFLAHSSYIGGELQHLVLAISAHPEPDAIRGFTVGFFSTLEQVIRLAVKPLQSESEEQAQ